jgi:hypothetical protein
MSTSLGTGVPSPSSGSGSGESKSKSSASGNCGVGGGANGPSKTATWSYPASGSTPARTGYLALADSWLAKRRAATKEGSDPPQTIGSDPTRSKASDLPGLTNDSLDGRHWYAISSSATAESSQIGASIRATPSRDAMTSSGTASDHGADRASPFTVTGT